MKRFFLAGVFFCIFIFSCAEKKPAYFPVRGTNALLIAQSRRAREGALDFSKPKILEYKFAAPFFTLPNSSMEIEYEFNLLPSVEISNQYSLVLNTQEASWVLPMDAGSVCYSVPVGDAFNGHFNIVLEPKGKIDKNTAPVFQIKSIRFVERWFGFDLSGETLRITPFVFYSGYENNNYNVSFVIDVPDSFVPNPSFAEIEAVISGGTSGQIEAAGRRIETLAGTQIFYIPPGMFSAPDQNCVKETVLSGDDVKVFIMNIRQSQDVFPIPIKADPALILEYPKENWRENDYEIFCWDRFPLLLIFDTADYAAQDRLFKRLAFFVEKAGFRGRLANDAEIANLHGWNAHDYRAVDLARFFDTARRQQFPLLEEERELEKILLNEGIIRESGGTITEGAGAVLSISRESPEYLRYRLLAHEGFHGLFFLDEDFRDFSRRRWEQLPVTAKRFITSYFDYMAYDTKDEYLLVNEFMAYILQQTVSQSKEYFGKTAPSRLESSWRSPVLPKKDEASGTWPSLAEVFVPEAEAFSAYVKQRWGISAGRIWGLRVE